jgi:hypothetical protein
MGTKAKERILGLLLDPSLQTGKGMARSHKQASGISTDRRVNFSITCRI